jgi:predicted molibdopterin-dependent oxidoreductase YjgC
MNHPKIHLNLDGQEMEVNPGTTLLDACRERGASVPTLCHEDRLEPFGGCRMCLVELDGAPRLVPACKTPASNGMVVRSASASLERVRGTIAEMLMAEHRPASGGRPDAMEKVAKRFQLGAPPIQFPLRDEYRDRNRFIGFDTNACILCNRCVRYCDEIMAVTALEHFGQGPNAIVQPTDGLSFLDTSCELCGGCISSCPTGALYEKEAHGIAESACETTRTVCTFCGVGCVIDLNTKDGAVVKVTAEVGVGPNDGHLCTKGRFAWQFIHHGDRLTEPLVRGEDGVLYVATWEEAYARVVEGLSKVKESYGPDSIGFLASSRCTNEDVYALQKLARSVMGTNNVHSCAAT